MLSKFSITDFKNTRWFIAEKIIHLIAGIIVIPKIFSSLGSVDIGGLKYAESIVGLLMPLFFLGLSEIGIREIIYKPKKTLEILSTALFLRIFSWIVVTIGLVFFILFVFESKLFWIYIIISLSYLFRVTDVMEYYFQAVKKVKIIFISKVVSIVIISILQYYGVHKNFDVYYFAELIALDFLLQGIILFVFFRKYFSLKLSDIKFSKNLSMELLKYSYPLIISNLLVSFYITIDEIFLKYYHNDEAVGLFASVQFLVIYLTWNIGFSIINALYPSLAESYLLEDKREYFEKIISLLRSLVVLGVLIAFFYIFFGDWVLLTFFSEEYLEVSNSLKVFSWAPLIIFTGMVFEKHLVNTGNLTKNIYRFFWGIVSNLILSYLLIPKYNIMGAAISTLISHFVVNIAYIYFDKDSRTDFYEMMRFFMN